MRYTQAATLGSAALLGGAYAFQHLGGLAPCEMCIWQRYPHVTAISIGLIIRFTGEVSLAWFGALAALTTSLIGFFHVGVEQGWWDGPTACAASDISGLSPSELMDQILTAPLVRCDEIAWALAGISMAGWNAIISLGLAALWVKAARHG